MLLLGCVYVIVVVIGLSLSVVLLLFFLFIIVVHFVIAHVFVAVVLLWCYGRILVVVAAAVAC